MRKEAIAAILALSMMQSCTNNENNTTQPSIIEDLSNSGYQIQHTHIQNYPDGSEGYTTVIYSEKGKLANKSAIWKGKLISLREAKKRFKTNYIQKWGRSSFPLSQLYNKNPTSKTNTFVIFKNKPTSNPPNIQVIQYGEHWIGTGIISANEAVMLAKSNNVLHVAIYEDGGRKDAAEGECPAPPQFGGGSARSSWSDNSFNQNGFFGEGINIGIQESIQNACKIRDDHNALAFASTISYNNTSIKTCNNDNDCDMCCYGSAPSFDCDDAMCINGECVVGHTTAVTSRISHTTMDWTQPRHAAKASFYIDNENDVITLPSAIKNIEYFKSEGVNIVNQSYQNYTFYDAINAEHWLVAEATRNNHMLFVRSSGNDIFASSSNCPVDAICVGNVLSHDRSTFEDDKIAPTSGYYNRSDIEFPDLVAEGDCSDAADITQQHYWRYFNRTSAAAPTVTGAMALLYQKCKTFNPSQYDPNTAPGNIPLSLRAKLRTSSYSPHTVEENPTAPTYPTPGHDPNYDSKAGTGVLNALNLYRDYCHNFVNTGEADPNAIGTDAPVTYAYDGNLKLDAPEWTGVPVWLISSQMTTQTTQGDVVSQPLINLLSTDMLPYVYWGPMSPGTRVRVSFSFLSCPVMSKNTEADNINTQGDFETIKPAVDFDIALCDLSNEKCYGISQSVDDTDEGFDIFIDEYVEKPTLVIFKPNNVTSGCTDEFEPFSIAAAVWPGVWPGN